MKIAPEKVVLFFKRVTHLSVTFTADHTRIEWRTTDPTEDVVEFKTSAILTITTAHITVPSIKIQISRLLTERVLEFHHLMVREIQESKQHRE